MFADILFEFAGRQTSRWLLPILSFGRAKADDYASERIGFNWLGFQRLPDGSLLFSGSMSACIGILFWTLLLVAVIVARNHT